MYNFNLENRMDWYSFKQNHDCCGGKFAFTNCFSVMTVNFLKNVSQIAFIQISSNDLWSYLIVVVSYPKTNNYVAVTDKICIDGH